jgi:hypothetical protein
MGFGFPNQSISVSCFSIATGQPASRLISMCMITRENSTEQKSRESTTALGSYGDTHRQENRNWTHLGMILKLDMALLRPPSS